MSGLSKRSCTPFGSFVLVQAQTVVYEVRHLLSAQLLWEFTLHLHREQDQRTAVLVKHTCGHTHTSFMRRHTADPQGQTDRSGSYRGIWPLRSSARALRAGTGMKESPGPLKQQPDFRHTNDTQWSGFPPHRKKNYDKKVKKLWHTKSYLWENKI